MRTAEKWVKSVVRQVKEDRDAPIGTPYYIESLIEQIQLDAMKECAKMCHNSFQSQAPYFETLVLSAVKRLSEKNT